MTVVWFLIGCAPHCSHPIVVCGEPGSGKTSLLAKMADLTGSSSESSAPVVLRFLGTTGQSTTTRELLRSLCQQLQKINGEEPDEHSIPKVCQENMCTDLENAAMADH